MNAGSLILAAVTLLGAAPSAPMLDTITPPQVPGTLAVETNETPFLVAHAAGTQNYICLPTAAGGFAWVLFGPQATLFDDEGGQVITHFLSANPVEGGVPRPTWQHSRDTSSVWAALVAQSSDSAYVAPNSIPWFLLRPVGSQFGPENGGRLTRTSAIHRINTLGGLAPSTGCAGSGDVGRKSLVPYSADYVFYRVRTN